MTALEPDPNPLRRGFLAAVLAALAFGATTPFVKRFGVGLGPFSTAALLYAGAALSCAGSGPGAAFVRAHGPRLFLIAFVGAFLAPVSLSWGLQHTSAWAGSLLLNFEAVFTVAFGWLFYREHVSLRVVVAALSMVGGGILLVGAARGGEGTSVAGSAAVVLATLCWASDNTLTRPFADLDPRRAVLYKSLIGALLACAVAALRREPIPRLVPALGLVACGGTGYGASLRFYLLAQARIGVARTGSIFALAPFIGAALAWTLGDSAGGTSRYFALALFGLGAYLHLTEKHRHFHEHEAIEHEHLHRHDDGHHDHEHEPPVQGAHSHRHRHGALVHDHPHGEDLHHRHKH